MPATWTRVDAERKETDNDLIYEDEVFGSDTAAEQQKAYPNVQSISSDLSVADATNRAANVLAGQGIEVVSVDAEQGIVEATATTQWFGFKDDVVVRAQASGDVTIVDVRSVSRVGRSDIGANAARIEAFIAAFSSI